MSELVEMEDAEVVKNNTSLASTDKKRFEVKKVGILEHYKCLEQSKNIFFLNLIFKNKVECCRFMGLG
jgi:hypothetical protein